MYEFDKEGYLTACDYRSLDMLYNTSSAGKSESRDKLLHYIKNLADAYEAAINLLNTHESAKSGGSESESTKNAEDRTITETISDKRKKFLNYTKEDFAKEFQQTYEIKCGEY